MPVFHFLNVKNGDCSIIEHAKGNVTVIDVCNAEPISSLSKIVAEDRAIMEGKTMGNFNQKADPVNPIRYMRDRGINDIFRFVVTHPDMDHLDGIKALFDEFSPTNLWDTDNVRENDEWDSYAYSEDDWTFYKNLRDSKPTTDPKRLTLYAGSHGKYYDRNEDDKPGGDGLSVLAPTPDLLRAANECGKFNDSSYVILYRSHGKRILIAGDSEDDTWEHILANHKADVKDVDVYLASHHGRDSGRSFDFLNVVNPVITFFGNAPSDHLAYGPFWARGLEVVTNNQANCILVDIGDGVFDLYVTHEPFARKRNANAFYSSRLQAWYSGPIGR
jgi:competence protein ComEC